MSSLAAFSYFGVFALSAHYDDQNPEHLLGQ